MIKNNTINVRPNQLTCIKCKDHGICEAETGNDSYRCPYMVCKKLREGI